MKSTENHTVTYGSRNIRFSLEYSPRKTLAIEVHPDRSILVKAPQDATLETIEAKVSHRSAWITKQQTRFSQYAPPLPAPEYVSGEGYRYLGRQYRLKLIEQEIAQVRLWQGRLEVRIPTPQNREQVEQMIDHWYNDRALAIFKERYTYCTQLVSPYQINHDRGIELRSMLKRWGSYTPTGKIFLNPLLISAPKHCIDYVIIHELCHIRIPNHSSQFYKLLETILPDWKTRQDYLNDRIELRRLSYEVRTPS
jgi:predicted metal-dependent hydrolase